MTRAEARLAIREAAAKHRRRTNLAMLGTIGPLRPAGNRPFPMKMPALQQSVCIVRRWGLVSDDVLAAAGFRPGKHPRRPKGQASAAA